MYNLKKKKKKDFLFLYKKEWMEGSYRILWIFSKVMIGKIGVEEGEYYGRVSNFLLKFYDILGIGDSVNRLRF